MTPMIPMPRACRERLESATEALRVIVMFASKDVTEFPRIFFTNDVIALLCDEKPAIPPERYCTVLEKKEDLLWARIFARDYMNFLFEPHKPDRLRPLLDIKPTHQPKDRTISTFTGKTTVTISNRRKEYKKLLQKCRNSCAKAETPTHKKAKASAKSAGAFCVGQCVIPRCLQRGNWCRNVKETAFCQSCATEI